MSRWVGTLTQTPPFAVAGLSILAARFVSQVGAWGRVGCLLGLELHLASTVTGEGVCPVGWHQDSPQPSLGIDVTEQEFICGELGVLLWQIVPGHFSPGNCFLVF